VNTAIGATAPIVLPASTAIDTVDAGLIPLACIGDRVWHDADGNGLQDATESGIPNVVVQLRDANDSVTLGATTTDVNGAYRFCSLLGDTYRVRVMLPSSAWTFTNPKQGVNGETDSDIVPPPSGMLGTSVPVVLQNGVSRSDIDSGLYLLGSVGDFVWLDVNADGVQQDNESGIATVFVRLLDGHTMAELQTTFTNASGYYRFGSLASRAYLVEFNIDPITSTFSPFDVGADIFHDSNVATYNSSSGAGLTELFVLAAQENRIDIDAGVAPFMSIGDYVWLDGDANGLQDPGELGAAGVTVELQDTVGNVLRTTNTDASGHYLFAGLVGGSYRVAFVVNTSQFYFSPPNSPIDVLANSKVTVAIANGGATDVFQLSTSRSDIDAGIVPLSAIGDYVWLDVDRDGLQDVSEMGVAGITVTLLVDDVPLATTVTDANGHYLFVQLKRLQYVVQFTIDASHYKFTDSNEGADDTLDSDVISVNGSLGRTASFTLAPGQTQRLDIDAGLQILPAQIGDTVWLDTNADSFLNNGETGVANVTVQLFTGSANDYLNDGALLPLATSVTDAAGHYLFSDLNPGSYWVKFLINDTVYAFSPYVVGRDSAVSDLAHGRTPFITLQSGQSNLNLDAGIFPLAQLGGLAWSDADSNGIRIVGEAPVKGVLAVLMRAGVPLAQTLTADDGSYLFARLAPATYYVAFLLPPNYVLTVADQGADDTVDSDVNGANGFGTTSNIVLNPGDNVQHIDVGLIPFNPPPPPSRPSAITGIVWYDGDCKGSNGVFYRDQPADGIVVSLYFANGTLYGQTMTDETGTYLFADIPANTDYYVQFPLPSGYQFLPPNAVSEFSDIDSDVIDFVRGTTAVFHVGSYELVSRQSDAGYQIECETTPTCAECADLTDVFCHLNQDHIYEYRASTAD
jgi:protocatechuate 3,4-dioxygenase beta subunit